MNFTDDLAKLCQRELSDAKRDPERSAEMVERLIHSLATTAVYITRGDQSQLSELLMGCESHLNEVASEIAAFTRLTHNRA